MPTQQSQNKTDIWPAHHALTWGLFASWKFYTLHAPHLNIVMNKGFPEISPSGVKYWSMTPPEKVAEHWSTIKSHWERKMYKSAMRLICSADTLEMWEKNGLLDKPRVSMSGASPDKRQAKAVPGSVLIRHAGDLEKLKRGVPTHRVELHPRNRV
ncbi:hypothetical protein CALCODRAFT_244548 [Calocera cornea HHB12733]|uniref:Uncharacterized protein n=1 Tax=Calocera cornea HHB12733 TaxID=1353952 RepID=A0A165JTA3_9BASI|nr:hypothetical protein CALCODRAFT_244548 [Calocera cornea HHB12733]